MKTIAIMMVALLAISLVAPMALAETDSVIAPAPTEDETEVEVASAGVTPDSPLYGLDKAMERLRLAFARGEVNKAKLKLKYAEERLSETEQMLDEGNEEAAAESEEAYNEGLEETQELVEGIEADGDEDTAEEALNDVSEIKLGLMAHAEKVAFVKDRILDRMRAGNASDEKIAHLEEVFGRIKAKAQETEQKMEEKRTRVRTTYKVLSGKNESELEGIELRIRERVEDKIKVKIKERVGDDESEVEVEIESEDEENDSEDDGNKQGGRS